jgi:hypothetical protein
MDYLTPEFPQSSTDAVRNRSTERSRRSHQSEIGIALLLFKSTYTTKNQVLSILSCRSKAKPLLRNRYKSLQNNERDLIGFAPPCFRKIEFEIPTGVAIFLNKQQWKVGTDAVNGLVLNGFAFE